MSRIGKSVLLILCLFAFLSQISLIQVKAYQMDREAVRNLIKIDYDEAIFTTYAFMNFTGFKDNNQMPFHPVRQGLLDDLAAKNLQLRDNHYFLNKDQPDYFYTAFLLIADGPPHFRPVHFNKLPAEILNNYGILSSAVNSDLGAALAEFYEKADIPSLYEKYRPDYEAEIARVKEGIYDGLEYVFNAFRLDPQGVGGGLVMDVNFLMPMGRAETFGRLHDLRRGGVAWMQYGPNPRSPEDGGSAVHELMHSYVDAILLEHKDKVIQFILANDIEPAGPYSASQMVDEAFVRAIECLHTGTYVNNDTINFPRSRDIFNLFFSDHDPETDDLETFILKALDAFTNQEGNPIYDQGYEDGLAQGISGNGLYANEDIEQYTLRNGLNNLASDHVLSLSFDLDLDLSTLESKNIFITDATGLLHPVFYLVDRNSGSSKIHLIPARAYEAGGSYTLWVKDIRSKEGKTLSQWYRMDFKIAE